MDVYYIRMGGGEGFLAVPWWWFDVLLIWLALMGSVIWLFGSAMVRATLTVWGLSFGAVLGWLFVRLLSNETPAVPWIMIGGLVGAVGGFAAYRLLLGVAFGLLLGLSVTCVVTAVLAPTEVSVWSAMAEGASDVRGTVLRSTEAVEEARAENRKLSHEQLQQFQIEPRVLRALRLLFKAFGAWWSEMGLLMGGLAAIVFLIAAGGGTLLGLMFEKPAVTLVTGLGGALMMLAGLAPWIGGAYPSGFLSWWILLAAVGGVGVVIQSALFKDESSEDPV